MTRMGLWDDGKSLSDNLAVVSPAVSKALLLPSFLWKEYAIEHRLSGYAEAAERREASLRADPSQGERLALRKEGKCLRRGQESSPQGEEEQEKGAETQVSAVKTSPEGGPDQTQKEGPLSLDKGLSGCSWSTVASRGVSSQEERPTSTAPLKPGRRKTVGDPAKDPRQLLSPAKRGSGRGGRSGRES